jgi:hypothetical protein
MDESEIRKSFWGAADEPVPQVDASDVKAVWDMQQDVKKSHPAGGGATGVEVFKAHCKPGANISAITYRANMIWMLQHVSPEIIDPLIQEKLDAVFLAAAEIPMEWIGENGRKGFPFDPDDFVRRVRAA